MKYEEKIVALIDILGFKDLVNDESKCEDIGAILKLPYLMRHDDMVKMFKIKSVMMTSISDSLVFSIGLKERGAMNKIVKLLSVFMQTLLFQYQLLLRGGIAVGKLYHDGDVVYGPALVKVHELESEIAVFPRIIMIPSDFERSILSCSKISQEILRKIIVPDTDTYLMLDCFRYAEKQMLESCHSALKQTKISDLKAQQKIDWMLNKIDKKLEESII
jgi:hypothetical protein